MRPDRDALTLPLLGLLALGAGWLAFQAFRAPISPEAAETVERPRYHIDGAHWQRYGKTGELSFEAHATGIDYFDDASMELSGIEMKTYSAGQQGSWQLAAERGSVPSEQKRMQLKPEVKIDGHPQGQQAISIVTPTLWADWEARSLSTSDPIVAQSPGRRVSAVGLRADWIGERVEFLSKVESRYAPPR
mgnify:CR=1 FL=1